MKTVYTTQKTEIGYLESIPRPKKEDLDEFYKKLYYGEGVTDTYQVSYTEQEIVQKKITG